MREDLRRAHLLLAASRCCGVDVDADVIERTRTEAVASTASNLGSGRAFVTDRLQHEMDDWSLFEAWNAYCAALAIGLPEPKAYETALDCPLGSDGSKATSSVCDHDTTH